MPADTKTTLKIFLSTIAAVVASATLAFGANVTLRWDANDPAPEGYRVYVREDGASYNYGTPIWENDQTECTLTGLTEGTTYYFVVRAYDGDLESADSEEVSYTPPISDSNQAPSADAGASA